MKVPYTAEEKIRFDIHILHIKKLFNRQLSKVDASKDKPESKVIESNITDWKNPNNR
ncbi:MAG: hypothetical protein ACTSUP_03050 [Candidatus Heimdallarchaeaceae archaeon]